MNDTDQACIDVLRRHIRIRRNVRWVSIAVGAFILSLYAVSFAQQVARENWLLAAVWAALGCFFVKWMTRDLHAIDVQCEEAEREIRKIEKGFSPCRR